MPGNWTRHKGRDGRWSEWKPVGAPHPADNPDPIGTTPGETCNRVQPHLWRDGMSETTTDDSKETRHD